MVLYLHGYGAWIESDGKPLEEYGIEVKDNVISCYVCSEEGKAFILHFEDDGSHCSGNTTPSHNHGRSVNIEMDGSRVGFGWGDFMKGVISDGVHAGGFFRPYIFAPVDTTDDDAVAADDPKNEHIGTIQIELKRGTKLGPSTVHCGVTEPRTGPIHERSKKAGSHRVALGEGVPRRQLGIINIKYTDDIPWLTFRFLYRKRDMLKAQGIVPQSPVPSPPTDSPGPSVTGEGGKSKGKGVKREREGSGNEDVIEIFSDDEDLGSLQDELKRLQARISRKKAKKSVKREVISSADDTIDLI